MGTIRRVKGGGPARGSIEWRSDEEILARIAEGTSLRRAGATLEQILTVVNRGLASRGKPTVTLSCIKDDRERARELARENVFRGIEGHLDDLDALKQQVMSTLSALPDPNRLVVDFVETKGDENGRASVVSTYRPIRADDSGDLVLSRRDPGLAAELLSRRGPFYAILLRIQEDQAKIDGTYGAGGVGATAPAQNEDFGVSAGLLRQRGVISEDQYQTHLKVLHGMTTTAMQESGHIIDVTPLEAPRAPRRPRGSRTTGKAGGGKQELPRPLSGAKPPPLGPRVDVWLPEDDAD